MIKDVYIHFSFVVVIDVVVTVVVIVVVVVVLDDVVVVIVVAVVVTVEGNVITVLFVTPGHVSVPFSLT